ncbi:MAG: hypothetical protein AB7I50_03635 [Vicinamibacterales bacterium]
MQVKRFRSQTVRDALAQVRSELGPGAVVLSTEMVSDRGWRGWMGHRVVEVSAAAVQGMSESRPAEPVSQPPQPSPTTSSRPTSAPVTPAQDLGRADGMDGLVAKLQAAGLGRRLANDVASAIPEAGRRAASASLIRRAIVDTLEAATIRDTGFASIEVFVGPPGVGKTTTIAKIAAQERVRRGVRLGLIAADGFRAGAVDQLRLYADIIGAPFTVARTLEELHAAMAGVAGGSALVDTAGRGPRDDEARSLMLFLGQHPTARTHVVLAAATTPRDAARWLDLWQPARPASVVLTRLDETDSIGQLLDLLGERRLPVSYLGTGQRVPEDLTRATASALAAHLLGEPQGEIGEDA